MTHIVRNIAVMQHMVGEHLFQLFHEELGAVDAHQWAVKVRVLLQIAAELQQRGRIAEKLGIAELLQYLQHLCDKLVFDFFRHIAHIGISCQSGIGVRAIRMIARIAPTNAAAPMTANTFLLSFFFAALQISAAQAMQTAAATSAMPSVSHSQESSCRIFMRSSSPVR